MKTHIFLQLRALVDVCACCSGVCILQCNSWSYCSGTSGVDHVAKGVCICMSGWHLDGPCACLLLQVWLKPSAEMQFLYGNHVLKSGLGRITESTPSYTGVVVYSMSDIPLGFGLTAKSTNEARSMEPSGIVVLHQADVGEYLRAEDEL